MDSGQTSVIHNHNQNEVYPDGTGATTCDHKPTNPAALSTDERVISTDSQASVSGRCTTEPTSQNVQARTSATEATPIFSSSSVNITSISLNIQNFMLLIVISSGYFLSMMLMSVYISFFPGVAQDRGASNTLVGAMLSSFSLIQVVASPLVGHLVPRIGPRRVYLSGIVTSVLSSAMFGALHYIKSDSSFLAMCFVVRMIQAMGIVMIVTASFTMATSRFPQHIGLVSGILEATNGVASALGPSLGGFLYDLGGFSVPFYALASLFAVCGCFILGMVPNIEPTCQITPGKSKNHLGIFLRSYETWIISTLLLFVSFNWSAMSSFLQPHLASTLDMTASEVGVMFLVGCGAFAISAPIWGKLSGHSHNNYPQMSLCFLALSASLLIMEPSWLGLRRPSRALAFTGFSLKEMMMGGAFLPTLGMLLRLAGRQGLPEQLSTHAMVNSWWYSVRCSSDIAGPLWAGPLTDYSSFSTVLLTLSGLNLAMCLLAGLQGVLTYRRTRHCSTSSAPTAQSTSSTNSPLSYV